MQVHTSALRSPDVRDLNLGFVAEIKCRMTPLRSGNRDRPMEKYSILKCYFQVRSGWLLVFFPPENKTKTPHDEYHRNPGCYY